MRLGAQTGDTRSPIRTALHKRRGWKDGGLPVYLRAPVALVISDDEGGRGYTRIMPPSHMITWPVT